MDRVFAQPLPRIREHSLLALSHLFLAQSALDHRERLRLLLRLRLRPLHRRTHRELFRHPRLLRLVLLLPRHEPLHLPLLSLLPVAPLLVAGGGEARIKLERPLAEGS